MVRPDRVDVDGCASLCEMPGGAAMIEMNVTEKNVADIVRRETGHPHFERKRFESGVGAGIEEHDPVIRLERDRGDDTRLTKVASVENVDHR